MAHMSNFIHHLNANVPGSAYMEYALRSSPYESKHHWYPLVMSK